MGLYAGEILRAHSSMVPPARPLRWRSGASSYWQRQLDHSDVMTEAWGKREERWMR